MLVLSRKEGERIWIGPEMELTILGIHKGKVRLGFAGPPEIPIRRQELERRIEPDRATSVATDKEQSWNAVNSSY